MKILEIAIFCDYLVLNQCKNITHNSSKLVNIPFFLILYFVQLCFSVVGHKYIFTILKQKSSWGDSLNNCEQCGQNQEMVPLHPEHIVVEAVKSLKINGETFV